MTALSTSAMAMDETIVTIPGSMKLLFEDSCGATLGRSPR
jgi:hypothetical protein